MPVTPIKPGTGANIVAHDFRRLYLAEDMLDTTNGIGHNGSTIGAPSAFRDLVKWKPNLYRDPSPWSAGNHNTNLFSYFVTSGVTPSTIGGIGLQCEMKPANGGDIIVSNYFQTSFGEFGTNPNFISGPYYYNMTTIMVVKIPYGVTQDVSMYNHTLLNSAGYGTPFILCYSDQTSVKYSLSTCHDARMRPGVVVTDPDAKDNQGSYEAYIDAQLSVGWECIVLRSTPTSLKVSLYRNGQLLTVDSPKYIHLSAANDTARPLYLSNFCGGSGQNKYNAGRASISSFAQFANGSISDADVMQYCQWMLDYTNGQTTFVEPTNELVIIGDSITSGWHGVNGVTYTSVLESLLRPSGVAVYSCAYPGSRALQWNDATTMSAIVNSSRLEALRTFNKKVFLINLGVNDISWGTSAANIMTALEGIADKARTYGGAQKVIAMVPVSNAGTGSDSATTKEQTRQALRTLMKANANNKFDGVIDTDVVAPLLCAPNGCSLATLRTVCSGIAFQCPDNSNKVMNGTLTTGTIGGVTASNGTSPPHPGPLGHYMMAYGIAMSDALDSAFGGTLGISTNLMQKLFALKLL